MAILQSRQLTKRFGGLVAVNRVSLAVEEGSIFGLVGPNGAGKSVFLNCVAGAQRPDDGRVIFRDQDTTGSPAERLCHLGLSRTFQIPQPFPRMTAIDTVLVAAHFGSPTDGVPPLEQARRSLRFVDFPHPEGTPVSGLNTVELKRLDLARALASRPKLLLLDELAAGLMTGQLGALEDILRKIRDSGVTIIMVEHVIRTILGLCDRLAVLRQGEKIADGPTREVAGDPAVIEAYLGQRR
ncbi:MAG: ABC transporter ATP-binding protein [Chloroflexi bacterium]|nr:MAG: ABC transporter ATP-binding protein [Chloroflexota bacterium]